MITKVLKFTLAMSIVLLMTFAVLSFTYLVSETAIEMSTSYMKGK